jgi:hypothetical protein
MDQLQFGTLIPDDIAEYQTLIVHKFSIVRVYYDT